MILTRPTAEDAARITELCQDPGIQRWTFVPSPYGREDAEFFLEKIVAPGWEANSPTWAIRLLPGAEAAGESVGDAPVQRALGDATPEHVAAATLHGMIGLTDRGGGNYEVGYWLDPDARGRGLMTAALDTILEVAADVLGAQVVTWRCTVLDGEPNWASWRVAWCLGFRHEGTIRRAITDRGTLRDAMVATWLPGDPRRPVEPWRGPLPLGDGAIPARPDARDPEALVRQFHATYGLPVATGTADVDIDRIGMRMGLIAEEFAELMGAVYGPRAEQGVLDAVAAAVAGDEGTRDTVEAADALADLVYVIYGMALETGIPMREVLAEVQASNLSKLGEDGAPIYRADGKVLKGPWFRDPDITRVLREHPVR